MSHVGRLELTLLKLSLRATDLLGQVETGMTKVKTHIDSIGFASLSLGAPDFGAKNLLLWNYKKQIPRFARDDNLKEITET